MAESELGALSVPEELQLLRESEMGLRKQLAEQRRRESKTVLRHAVCEAEKRKLDETMTEMQLAMQPPQKQVRTLLLDPSVNAEIVRLREQVKELERREKEAQQELEASQFQASSIAGKKLMQKCKELQQENEQLGKELSEGKVQKLEATIEMQKVGSPTPPSGDWCRPRPPAFVGRGRARPRAPALLVAVARQKDRRRILGIHPSPLLRWRSQDYAKKLERCLAEKGEWVEQLDEELEALQSTVISLRRELQTAR